MDKNRVPFWAILHLFLTIEKNRLHNSQQNRDFVDRGSFKRTGNMKIKPYFLHNFF